MVEPSQLVVSQREVSIASFDIGAGALEDLRELGCLSLQLRLLHWTQGRQRPTGRKQRGPEALGQRPQRLACGDRPGRGHASELSCGDELGMHGVGHGRCHVQLPHLLTYGS